MRRQTPVEKELEDALYTDRLLVLIESEEGFRQVILTQAQYHKVGDIICLSSTPNTRGGKNVLMREGRRVIDAEQFDGMLDYYSDEIIDLLGGNDEPETP